MAENNENPYEVGITMTFKQFEILRKRNPNLEYIDEKMYIMPATIPNILKDYDITMILIFMVILLPILKISSVSKIKMMSFHRKTYIIYKR